MKRFVVICLLLTAGLLLFASTAATKRARAFASADLSVAKVDTPDPVNVGSSLTYTITINNNGPDAAANSSWSDTLPAGTTFLTLNGPGAWSCNTPATGDPGTVNCSNPSFTVGSAVFTLSVMVAPTVTAGTTISNTATVTSTTPEGNPGNESGTATTTVLSPANVSGKKSVSGGTSPGSTITYIIQLSNSSSSPQQDNPGDEFTDLLPSDLTLVAANASSGIATANTGTNTVTWNGVVDPGSSSITISIDATIKSGTTGNTIANQGSINYDADGNGTNESSRVTDDPTVVGSSDSTNFVVGIASLNADMGVTKSASVDSAAANSNVTYTITVSNGGPDTATDATLNDPLPGNMTFVSLLYPAGWDCTPLPSVGSGGTVTCKQDLPAGSGPQAFTLVGHIPSGTANNTFYNNVATVSTTATDSTSENNSSSAGTTVNCSTGLVTTSADTGAGSLRQAIADVCDGATITFDMNQVLSPITLTSGELVIDKSLTITGPGANQLMIQRSTNGGTPQFRIFNHQVGKTSTISGLTINNGNISSNAAGVLNAGTLTLSNLVISGNISTGTGGGVLNSGTMTVNGSTVTDNTAVSGSGIGNTGTLTVTNATFSGNSSDGVANVSGTTTITNSTFSANTVRGITANTGTVNLGNTIVANTPGGASDIFGAFTSQGNNLIGNGSDGTGFTNGVNSDIVGMSGAVIDPRLGLLANNGGSVLTHALLSGSPALDAGSNTLANNAGLTLDQRGAGFQRIVDGPDANTTDTVDIGAFEAQVSLEDITDKATNEDTQLQFVFNVGGAISSVSATSSNTTLVPNNVANIAVSGSGSTRTLTINPALNQFGQTTITVTVDGSNSQSMTDTFVLTVTPIADTPSVTNATTNEDTLSTSGLVISRNAADGAEVTHFRITSIVNGALFKHDGLTPINNGDSITFAEGNAGLRFTPVANLFSPSTTFSLDVKAATGSAGQGLSSSAATATITVNPVADTPSVTDATTIVNTQTTSGLVISRNAVDGAEVANFRITNITGGGLFKNNGTTMINNNEFITFAEGNAGLKFTPTNNSNSNGSFQVQGSLNSTNGGLGGGLATATITINCGPTVVSNTSDSAADSLRDIILHACSGATITFAPVMNGKTITLTSGELVISKNLVIQGPGADVLTISGNNASRVFKVNSGVTATLSGLTITGGRATDASTGGPNGGGIFNSGTLTVTSCAVSGNNTVTSSGQQVEAGGIYSSSNLTVANSTISGNTANSSVFCFGGGITSIGSTLTVTGSTISGNTCSGSNGSEGGGIYIKNTANITNSTISGNTATASAGDSFGGGIFNVSGTSTFTNSTISGNTSSASGQGSGGGIFGIGTTNFKNTIVAGNSSTGSSAFGPDVSNSFTSQGNNLIGKSDGTSGFNNGVNGDIVGTIAAPVNALLAPLANYGGSTQTVALLPGSPAINAGTSAGAPSTDQRGISRVGAVDIGAFESRGFTASVINGSSQSATILSAFGSPLTVLVSGVAGEPVSGGRITFNAPLSGASATLTGGTRTSTATINAGAQASTNATANAVAGTYSVTTAAAGATSASFTLTNNKAATTTTVASSVNPSDLNQNVTFTATVTGVALPTGTVQFKDNGTNLGAPATLNGSGVAQLTNSSLTTGSHTITADYSGDGNFLASSGTLAGGQIVRFRPLIKFSQPAYSVNENGKFITITVIRTGDTSLPVTVDFTTPDDSAAMTFLPCSNANGVASPRCDFTTALGTLRFGAGETTKTFNVLISQDVWVEGNETVPLTLSNVTGGAAFLQPSDANAVLTIVDDDTNAPSTNPIDNTDVFVRQHYHDFLNREADTAGLNFWVNQIESCGADAQCRAVKRVNVSAAFFLSIEFQNTGYFVERMYKAGFGDINPPTVPVPVRFTNFLGDTQDIGAGVVVGVGNWQAQLDANKRAFALAFVQRPGFLTRYPPVTSATAFVDALNQNAGFVLRDAERSSLISQLSGDPSNPALRADVLMKVAENSLLQQSEFNRAFVLMQFFGYLRRNPDAAPEQNLNFGGYNFWVSKLNQFNGDFIGAEMIKAFLSSSEYRGRFGP